MKIKYYNEAKIYLTPSTTLIERKLLETITTSNNNDDDDGCV